jgi:D-3-phosphoglycerate dehydrogenase
MQKFKVYVAEKSYEDYSAEQEIVEKAGGNLLFARCNNEKDIIEQCADANAILLRQTPLGAQALEKLKKLRVISRYGVGYDNVDIEAASRRGVVVTIVPDYCVSEVADHTIAMLLSSIRRIPLRDRLVREGGWDLISGHPVYRTKNKTLGLIGYGKTAREVRKRLSGFPFRFAAYDPFVPENVFKRDNVLRLDFHSIVMISHYISIHVPLNEETYHMFSIGTFRKMRRSAILINTSRGQIVDINALYTALKEKFISMAALDVYENEPYDVKSPLSALDTVILSDHASWYSEESRRELQIRTALEAVRVLCGEMPENPVNPSVFRSSVRYREDSKFIEAFSPRI